LYLTTVLGVGVFEATVSGWLSINCLRKEIGI